MASHFALSCLLNSAVSANATATGLLDSAFTQNPWFAKENRLASLLANRSASPTASPSDELSENSRQLISAIRNASVHGLDPDSYGLSQILITIDALSAPEEPLPLSVRLQETGQPADSKRLRKSLSAQMDLAFVRLATHLGEGVVDARATQGGLFRDPPRINTTHLPESVWSGHQTAMEALDSVTSTQAEYQRLTTRMHNLLTERTVGIERPVIANNGVLSAAMNHEDVLAIKRRLMETGALAPGTVLTPRFDSELVSAVRLFQQRHGLEADGAVDHQTPTFSRDMSYMEFNPTWTIPKSIANEELIPKERRRPGYLMSRQFDFLKHVNDQLVPVPPETVTTDDFASEPFPYTLRQRGGSMNDLGRIKFMMPNPYAVYLHDTPAKRHFTLNERAYSHGCIRLSDPDKLAKLLMREDNYSSSAIHIAMQAPQTHRIPLRDQIPTHLTYMTTWIDDAGNLQRRADIYQHDAALMIALQASDTLLSTLHPSTASLADPTLPVTGKS